MSPRTILVILALMIAVIASSQAADKSDSVVKATATAEKPDKDGKQVVTITLDVDPKYYIYANPVGNEDFESNATTVTLTKGNKSELVKVEYPTGEVVKDKDIGEYKKLTGKVAIKVVVTPKESLAFDVKIQACSKTACLAPSTIKVKVP